MQRIDGAVSISMIHKLQEVSSDVLRRLKVVVDSLEHPTSERVGNVQPINKLSIIRNSGEHWLKVLDVRFL